MIRDVEKSSQKKTSICEYLFGEFLLDVMKISGDVFQELLSKKAQVAGYFFRQNPVDHSYDFIVFIK